MSEQFYGKCGKCGGDVVTYMFHAGHQVPTCKKCGAKVKGSTLEMEEISDIPKYMRHGINFLNSQIAKKESGEE